MKRFSDKDVTTAVGYMKELTGGLRGAALVSREQIDRIAEINRDPDPISRADKTLAMSQQMIKDAEDHLAHHKDELRGLGVAPDFKPDDGRFNAEGRKSFQEANDEFSAALEHEIDAEAARVMALAMPAGGGLPKAEHAWA